MAFPKFYLTQMGSGFLRGYYESVLSYPKRLALIAIQSDEVVGFAVGFLEPERFYAHLRGRRWRLLPAMAWALLRSPALIGRTLQNARRVQGTSHPPGTVELSSIAVAQSARGLGSTLLGAFLEQARTAGASSVALTTDAVNNDVVNRFYRKHGFFVCRTFDDGGRIMNEYHLELKR